ncbi:MAG: hypothetical protein IKO78_06300 [Bacilli bacterium]|nr:hypothetical protein [Bacilli bacterium]
MLTIADKIRMIEKEIERLSQELENMDPKDPDNRFKYANKQSELNIQRRKLEEFIEKQNQENSQMERTKTGKFITPFAGDDRYKKYTNKNALDIFRIAYYKELGKDATIADIGQKGFFDSLSPMSAYFYHIKDDEPVSYKLVIKTEQEHLSKDNNASVGTIISTDCLFSEAADGNMRVATNFMTQYTGSPINLIISDNKLKQITFARISDHDMGKKNNGEKDYYGFFERLYDGESHNVVFISPDLTRNASQADVIGAANDFVLPTRRKIAEENGFKDVNKLLLFNGKIKKKVLGYINRR